MILHKTINYTSHNVPYATSLESGIWRFDGQLDLLYGVTFIDLLCELSNIINSCVARN